MDDSAPPRSAFPVLRAVPTRWADNDHYGHVNNVVHDAMFDTTVNGYLIEAAGTDIRELPAIGLVMETSCRYLAPVSFPDVVHIGLATEVSPRSFCSSRVTPASSFASSRHPTGRTVAV